MCLLARYFFMNIKQLEYLSICERTRDLAINYDETECPAIIWTYLYDSTRGAVPIFKISIFII